MKYFDYEYRVRYGDTDRMGISYYANYLVWFEAARTEYFRSLGIPYTECEKRGYFLPAIEAGIRYHAPSYYDDLLTIRTSVNLVKISSMRFEYQVFRHLSQPPLATGFTAHTFVDREMKPTRIPDDVKKAVTPFQLLK